MNPFAIVIGFAPLVLFGLLDQRIPVTGAAVVAALAAVIIVAVIARRGIPVLPIVQAVTLAIIAAIAFAGGPAVHHFLAHYGRGIASLALAAYMLITVPFAPFTAFIARAGVSREVGNTPRFIDLNRRISAAWGLAVLVLGLSHLASAAAGSSLTPFQSHLLEWGPGIVALIAALRFTRRTVSQAHGESETTQRMDTRAR